MEDNVRGAHRASRGVDRQDYGLDVVVLSGLIQLFLHPAGGSDRLGEGQDTMGALHEHPGNIQKQDLVTAGAGDGRLLQGLGLLEEVHLDGDAAGQRQQQDTSQDQGIHSFGLHKRPFRSFAAGPSGV